MINKSNLLFCSVVIITHERPSEIAKCIKSIQEAQHIFNRPTEIIVIDSSIKNINQYSNDVILFLKPEMKSAAAKRNVGIKKSQANWVIFIDDDCTVPKYFFNYINKAIHSSTKKTGGWYGVTQFKGQKGYAFRACEKSSFTEAFRMPMYNKTVVWGPTSIALFRKKALESVGGFKEDFSTNTGGEDVDLGVRLTKSKWVLKTIPQVLAYHDTATWNTIKQNIQRFIKYGRSDIDLARQHPRDTILKLNSGLNLLIILLVFICYDSINISSIFFRFIIFLLTTSLSFATYFAISLSIRLDLALLLVFYDRAYEFGTLSESVRQRQWKSLFFRFAYQEKHITLGRSKVLYPREIADIVGIIIAFLIIKYIIHLN